MSEMDKAKKIFEEETEDVMETGEIGGSSTVSDPFDNPFDNALSDVDLGGDEDVDPFENADESSESAENNNVVPVPPNPVKPAQTLNDSGNAAKKVIPIEKGNQTVAAGKQVTQTGKAGDSTKNPDSNPLLAAMNAAETKQATQTQAGLIGKPPVFKYANVTEDITDLTQTFEDIRKEKAADFPELEDAKRVTWFMEYGKIREEVKAPSKEVVGKMKNDIEWRKDFMDALKRAKGDVVCYVKPTVTAQKKGEMSGYKGVFTDIESAAASGKAICIVPSDDGNVYEVRNNAIGRFAAKTSGIGVFSRIRAGLKPALPPIPFTMFAEIVGFFRAFMVSDRETEALVNIYWDSEESRHCAHVPRQIVSKTMVETKLIDAGERFIHVMDVHSHNKMAAEFSLTDDADERATRIYVVIGRLDQFFPEVAARISCGGVFVDIEPSLVIEEIDETFPDNWLYQVVKTDSETKINGETGVNA
jgi:PRTRC genetic system protein A